jgi:hypothetical protein
LFFGLPVDAAVRCPGRDRAFFLQGGAAVFPVATGSRGPRCAAARRESWNRENDRRWIKRILTAPPPAAMEGGPDSPCEAMAPKGGP